ncbi:hypothetical protein [Streptomyces antimicrobicus]|uniref:DUF2470 domain-containing protein n=1 Tax=Streptomyces antimicrobicus TaxID=2883108 RepID=A0ABS8B2U2_9ACTN|nr:hypothetical protein [Streptomyces antimicrobicus]MCB5178920.1 hypothetical protein [Streptomyces antimicrobicus]
MNAFRKVLYADVAVLGGLGAAVEGVARERGCDIGTVFPASDAVRIETTRGVVSIEPEADQHRFRLSVHIPGFTWVIGSTDDLGSAVEAVAAWRGGLPLEEFRATFEFIELDEFVRALDNGEPTATQWADLLSSEFYEEQRGLLRRVHADEGLRELFPTVSHGGVRLRVDPLDGASRQVLVTELGAEQYRVVRVGVPEAAWGDVSADELISHLRSVFEKA